MCGGPSDCRIALSASASAISALMNAPPAPTLPQLGFLAFDLLDQLYAALAGHGYVEKQNIEIIRAHVLQHLVSVPRLADDIEVA